jgi:hypothetical protein
LKLFAERKDGIRRFSGFTMVLQIEKALGDAHKAFYEKIFKSSSGNWLLPTANWLLT